MQVENGFFLTIEGEPVFINPFRNITGSWLDEKSNIAAPSALSTDSGAGIKEEPGVTFMAVKPTEKGNYYEGYYLKRKPAYIPKPPEPYCIWKDTYAY